MSRSLLASAGTAAVDFADTITSAVPSSTADNSHHVSSTSLFMIYMVIGFSVTFACIFVLMMLYHCFR